MEKINDNILNLFDLNVQTLEKIKELYNGELEKENNENPYGEGISVNVIIHKNFSYFKVFL